MLKGFGKRIATALPEWLLGFDPTLPRYSFNIVKVREYLQKARNGEVVRQGIKFSVAYNQGNVVRQRVAGMIEMIKMYLEQAMLDKVRVEIQTLQ